MAYHDFNKLAQDVLKATQARKQRKANEAFTIIRVILAVVILIAAIAGGLWAGVWWAFIGGIVQVVNACQTHPVSVMGIALGVARAFFCGLIGWVTFGVGLLLARIFAGK